MSESAARPTIDVDLDFRSDAPLGCDPDAYSPRLREHHRVLWSKALPCGAPFALTETRRGNYLHHRSNVGEFWLSSDSAIPTFTRDARVSHIIEHVPSAEREAFVRLAYTIGAMIVFPANRVARRMTINGARGCHPQICDRFDLTLECIRRHYDKRDVSPLSDVLDRYSEFFALFGDFRGYAEFFLLHDLVTDDFSAVRFFLPFESFEASPLPGDVDAYRAYRDRCVAFIEARNRRIAATQSVMTTR